MRPRVAGATRVKINILPRAWADLEDGAAFYERQCTGLGDVFADHLVAQIRELKTTHGIHPLVEGGFHRFVTDQRFPFAVYYRCDARGIFIFAVLDCRRDPATIRERLSGE